MFSLYLILVEDFTFMRKRKLLIKNYSMHQPFHDNFYSVITQNACIQMLSP